MSNATIIKSGGLVTFEIKINGAPISYEIDVQSIQIDTKVNEISSAQITVLDREISTGAFPVSSSNTFIPGNKIIIEAGYDTKNEVIFKGIVTGQTIKIDSVNGSVLSIDCFDEAVKMTVGEKSKKYSQKTDSAIITSIIGNYSGLSSDVVATSAKWSEISQDQNTDWDFIRYRAEANGCIVITKDNKVTVLRPETNTASVLMVEYGNNLMSFQGNLNAINQLSSYTTEALSDTSEKVIKGKADNIYAGPGNLSSKKLSKVLDLKVSSVTSLPLQETTLKELSKAQLIKSTFSKIQGTLEVQGTDLVSSGKYITLEGLGDRFNGDHFVSRVSHTIEHGNWITKIAVGMNVVWITPESDRIGSSIHITEQGIQETI